MLLRVQTDDIRQIKLVTAVRGDNMVSGFHLPLNYCERLTQKVGPKEEESGVEMDSLCGQRYQDADKVQFRLLWFWIWS